MLIGGPLSPFFDFFLVGGKIWLYLQRHKFCRAKSNIEIQLQFFDIFLLKSRCYNIQEYHKLIIMSQKCLQGAGERC